MEISEASDPGPSCPLALLPKDCWSVILRKARTTDKIRLGMVCHEFKLLLMTEPGPARFTEDDRPAIFGEQFEGAEKQFVDSVCLPRDSSIVVHTGESGNCGVLNEFLHPLINASSASSHLSRRCPLSLTFCLPANSNAPDQGEVVRDLLKYLQESSIVNLMRVRPLELNFLSAHSLHSRVSGELGLPPRFLNVAFSAAQVSQLFSLGQPSALDLLLDCDGPLSIPSPCLSLTSLDLGFASPLSPPSLPFLSSFPNLRSLSLRANSAPEDLPASLALSLAAALPSLKALETLTLSGFSTDRWPDFQQAVLACASAAFRRLILLLVPGPNDRHGNTSFCRLPPLQVPPTTRFLVLSLGQGLVSGAQPNQLRPVLSQALFSHPSLASLESLQIRSDPVNLTWRLYTLDLGSALTPLARLENLKALSIRGPAFVQSAQTAVLLEDLDLFTSLEFFSLSLFDQYVLIPKGLPATWRPDRICLARGVVYVGPDHARLVTPQQKYNCNARRLQTPEEWLTHLTEESELRAVLRQNTFTFLEPFLDQDGTEDPDSLEWELESPEPELQALFDRTYWAKTMPRRPEMLGADGRPTLRGREREKAAMRECYAMYFGTAGV